MNPFSTKVIKNAANQSVRPYSTNQKYLFAMREDLAEWLKGLYGIDINAENFFDILETGILLCKHANNMTSCAKFMKSNDLKVQILPSASLTFNEGKHVQARSFFARDNIASFLGYCSEQLQIPDIVRFETNDLVLRLNEKNVILCLLEVARKGSKFGVPAPILVQMEEDIDAEIELDNAQECEAEPIAPPRPQKKRVNCDFKSLDEMAKRCFNSNVVQAWTGDLSKHPKSHRFVKDIDVFFSYYSVQSVLQLCTCPNQFPMVRVGDGKYKVGNSKNLIFMRILRQHVMVRVGGGWDTLEHYLNKHDPCRCHKHRTEKNLSPRIRSSSVCSVNKPRKSTVEIKLSPPTSNVFQRLSQPRMSPPVASTASSGDPVFQDDMLIVERNQRGTTEVSHRVQRLSESRLCEVIK